MKKTVITYASILAISATGFAKSPDLGENYKLIQNDRIETKVTVEDLTGTPVYDKYGVEIGSVNDIQVNAKDGTLTTAYLSVGGTWGLGESHVSLPYDQLTHNEAENRFTVDTTESEIKAYIDHQRQSMKRGTAHQQQWDQAENKLGKMWHDVKSSLSVEDNDLAEVEAEIEDNTVYLEGEVESQALKNQIEKAFAATTDLRIVNKIQVEM
ncbi:PRC-barrel domain-containing protein [Coraliomargarita algicola]|uniref:PRC-barrel domain-containing protein n=1 Tax=Coraliomargarita algicola TaxID=3092156 RepID=A0ABZ0RRM9_9BACT|nr:PRC-barrel domain-containing protein [Coraliomargarita sp. J2-16]WPJ97828.1 PRC-barrel domain-containing protein [Coraliomargarita sp. J2-16]